MFKKYPVATVAATACLIDFISHSLVNDGVVFVFNTFIGFLTIVVSSILLLVLLFRELDPAGAGYRSRTKSRTKRRRQN